MRWSPGSSNPLEDRSTLGRDLLVGLTWTGNLPHLTPDGATYHLWTLATEEQFYLLWPALLLLFLGQGRPGRALAVAGLATGLAMVTTVVWLADAPDLAYALPTSWALCFVVGAAARLRGHALALPRWAPGLALTGLLLLALVPLRGRALTYLVAGPSIAVLTAGVLLAWRNWEQVFAGLRALVLLGTVSYAAYLWNYPLALWLRPVPGGEALAVVLTLVAAALSWWLVEAPLARRRTRLLP